MKRRFLSALSISGLVLASCTSDQTLKLRERTVTPLDSRGGLAQSADGKLSLNFPAGALSQGTEITIETHHDRTAPNLRSAVHELGPKGLTFSQPVTISIVQPSNGDELAIANLDDPEPRILETSTWDPARNEASATLQHFSAYGAVVVYHPCAGKVCGDPCTICDPAITGCVDTSTRACNRSGLCVAATAVTCGPPPDAGFPDAISTSTPTPDGGELDAGDLDADIPDVSTSTGTGGTCTSTFQQIEQPLSDILLVVDNSCSMFEEQMNLASSFPQLLDTLTTNNVDFHIGVTTTDVDMGGAAGALVGSPNILTSTTPSLAAAFSANVMVGTDGSAFEQGLEASRRALTAPLNPGFLRPDSWLLVLYVTDEDDQSPAPLSDYTSFLASVRPNGHVQANTITGDVPAGCATAEAGLRYDGVRAATGGIFSSICNLDWAAALTDLGGAGFGYQREFTLPGTPPPTSVISVEIDGRTVPTSDWSYDPATGVVTFSTFSVPEPGAVIVIRYGC